MALTQEVPLRLLIPVLLLFGAQVVQADWVRINNGLPRVEPVQSLAVNGSTLFAGTVDSGIYRSDNNGDSWKKVNVGLRNPEVLALAVSGANLFAGTVDSGLYRSIDNGNSWLRIKNGLTDSNVFALSVNGANLFAGTLGRGVFRSTDNGNSWKPINKGLTDTSIFSLWSSGAYFFAGTRYGRIFRSRDNGDSWTRIRLGRFDTVYDLIVSDTTLFAGTYGGGVYRTDYRTAINDSSWTSINSGLRNTRISEFVISGATLFAGTYGGGVYRTAINGDSWTRINEGLRDTSVHALVVSGGDLFAGTWLDGVFRRPLREITLALGPFGKARGDFGFRTFGLIRPGEGIRFETRQLGPVNLRVYNAEGKQGATLVNAVLGAGNHEAAFEAAGPQGLYFLRLQSGGDSRTTRVVLGK